MIMVDVTYKWDKGWLTKSYSISQTSIQTTTGQSTSRPINWKLNPVDKREVRGATIDADYRGNCRHPLEYWAVRGVPHLQRN